VIGLDFSGGIGSVANQLNAVLGATGLQFSNTSGTTLRILDDGAANTVNIGAASATVTETSLTGGSPELPLFTDGSGPYTGAITSGGSQSVGFAGRIAVNPNLKLDPSKLTIFNLSPLTPDSDSTRADFIYDRLTQSSFAFSPDAGIGTADAPFRGSLQEYLRQAVAQQGNAAASASSLNEGQGMVLTSLQERFDDTSGVNVDVELANLLNLQNAYAANARVMTTVRDMIDTLLKM
jgi:flagellar hook-associated protein 1 FlgK